MIEGRNVAIFTDHKPLVSTFKKQGELKSDRQQRHLSLVTELINEMHFIKGDQNVVADCLSRPTNAVSVDVCDLPAIASAQLEDSEIEDYSHRLKSYQIGKNCNILCDDSLSHPRPFVPVNMRKSIFSSLHNLAHPGIKGSQNLIKTRYFWPNIDKEIKNLVKECESCQISKIHRHTKSPINQFNLSSNRFHSVHMDIVGPLPPVLLYPEWEHLGA